MTHPADFADHASSPLAYDHTGMQNLQRRLINSAIRKLPRPEHRAFAELIYNGHTPTSAAHHMGQPASVGAAWWLDIADALGRKLSASFVRSMPAWERELVGDARVGA